MPVASPRGAATAFFDVRIMLCAPDGSSLWLLVRVE
jgi:hypothetical protein